MSERDGDRRKTLAAVTADAHGGTVTDATAKQRTRRGPLVGTAVALVLAVLSLAVLAVQVDVTDSGVGATRACGSAFDGLVDRAGWETWWAGDLDEPDDEIRSALVRTTRCPDAVNARIVTAAALAAVSVLVALAAAARHQHDVRRDPLAWGGARTRLARLGRMTTVGGTVLTVAGVVAVVVLVADADSTLFLYTDRFVVAVVGLVVLVPTVALVVIGRVVTILADTETPDADPDRPDGHRPPADVGGAESDAT